MSFTIREIVASIKMSDTFAVIQKWVHSPPPFPVETASTGGSQKYRLQKKGKIKQIKSWRIDKKKRSVGSLVLNSLTLPATAECCSPRINGCKRNCFHLLKSER
jgi:hypothetical protein